MKFRFIIFCLCVGSLHAQDLSEQWKYKKAVSIHNKENKTLTDYQVSFTFLTDSLINENKINSDLSDLRITSNDGKTLLCFWIDKETDKHKAILWVKIPVLKPNSEEIIFILYGNHFAKSIDDAACTFMLFDDFNGQEIDRNTWQVMGKQTPEVADGKIVLEASQANQMIMTKTTYERPVIAEMKVLNAFGSTISLSQLNRSEFGWVNGYSLNLNETQHSMQIDLLEPSNCGGYSFAGSHSRTIAANEIKGIWSLSWITENDIMAHWPGGDINEGNIFNEATQIKVGMGIIACNMGKKHSGKLEVDWIRIRKYTAVTPDVLIGEEIQEDFLLPTVSPSSNMLKGIS